jgi:hypothetical protein
MQLEGIETEVVGSKTNIMKSSNWVQGELNFCQTPKLAKNYKFRYS